jgi:L,D-transpeptidase ErfK/SrfK
MIVYPRHPHANVAHALAAVVSLCLSTPLLRAQAAGQVASNALVFLIHGTSKTCSAITQLDSALTSDYQPFFDGWTEKDYADAVAWSAACPGYGWQLAARPRMPLLRAQHDKMLGAPRPTILSEATIVSLPPAVSSVVVAQPQLALPTAPVRSEVAAQAQPQAQPQPQAQAQPQPQTASRTALPTPPQTAAPPTLRPIAPPIASPAALPTPAQIAPHTSSPTALPIAPRTGLPTALPSASPVTLQGARRAIHELPPDGGAVIGADVTITSHHEDTLPDIARRYSLGYEEIVRANPGVDVWLPGEGTRILLPDRRILPPGPREGVVVNLAERRLYYFPKSNENEKPVVITYPVSIGKPGQNTPLGQSYIAAKVKHPTWNPPAHVRREHADSGDPLPAVVGPGPDNPLGDFMMRLGFGDGTYEIHGTNKPAAVGMAITNGCIGMYPEDVEALFALVSVGTPVRLVDMPLKIAWSGGALLLEVHPPLGAPAQTSALSIERFSDLLRVTVHDNTIPILWDYARQALRKADGVIATVGHAPPVSVSAPALRAPVTPLAK